MVDSKEGSVFVQVSHGSRDREFANVYMSGSEGRAYTLSLRTVVKDYRGLSDFERINGVLVCVRVCVHYVWRTVARFERLATCFCARVYFGVCPCVSYLVRIWLGRRCCASCRARDSEEVVCVSGGWGVRCKCC